MAGQLSEGIDQRVAPNLGISGYLLETKPFSQFCPVRFLFFQRSWLSQALSAVNRLAFAATAEVDLKIIQKCDF